MSPDSVGNYFETLLATQRAHLLTWKLRIRAQMFDQIEAYVKRTNREAGSPSEKHRVYRGQDLVEIIRQWPDLDPSYEPVKPPAEIIDPADLI